MKPSPEEDVRRALLRDLGVTELPIWQILLMRLSSLLLRKWWLLALVALGVGFLVARMERRPANAVALGLLALLGGVAVLTALSLVLPLAAVVHELGG